MINTKDIIEFWFEESKPNMWFKKNLDFDNLIKNKFSETIHMSIKTSFEDIHISSEIYLSYIIVLDQFTRNVFRNTFGSFVGDKKALKLCKNAISNDFVNHENPYYNSFFFNAPYA
jgi:uncharacterized protein (DUF924 family)